MVLPSLMLGPTCPSRCILATDMARHNEILNRFKTIQPMFNFGNKEHKEVVRPRQTIEAEVLRPFEQAPSPPPQLMKIMVKVSDISNEARPMAVAEPWLDCLLQEFFNQVIYYLEVKRFFLRTLTELTSDFTLVCRATQKNSKGCR